MRTKVLGFLLGCGFAICLATPTLTCDYNMTSASSAQSQQTAQAQQTTQSDSMWLPRARVTGMRRLRSRAATVSAAQ